MGLITWIIVIIVFLAILGLGWDTFFSGVRKGADKIGISSIVENATNNTIGLIKNTSQEIIGDSLGKQNKICHSHKALHYNHFKPIWIRGTGYSQKICSQYAYFHNKLRIFCSLLVSNVSFMHLMNFFLFFWLLVYFYSLLRSGYPDGQYDNGEGRGIGAE